MLSKHLICFNNASLKSTSPDAEDPTCPRNDHLPVCSGKKGKKKRSPLLQVIVLKNVTQSTQGEAWSQKPQPEEPVTLERLSSLPLLSS